MIPLPSVLIYPRRVRRRRSIAPGAGVFLLLAILATMLRVMVS